MHRIHFQIPSCHYPNFLSTPSCSVWHACPFKQMESMKYMWLYNLMRSCETKQGAKTQPEEQYLLPHKYSPVNCQCGRQKPCYRPSCLQDSRPPPVHSLLSCFRTMVATYLQRFCICCPISLCKHVLWPIREDCNNMEILNCINCKCSFFLKFNVHFWQSWQSHSEVFPSVEVTFTKNYHL